MYLILNNFLIIIYFLCMIKKYSECKRYTKFIQRYINKKEKYTNLGYTLSFSETKGLTDE